MRDQRSAARDGVVVASGYGLKIYVERGHLVVHDGVGRDRNTRRFNRATSRLKRLVVLGESGFCSFDAIKWLRGIGAVYVQLDTRGDVLLVSGTHRPDDPMLRRAQALATYTETGVESARMLISEKLKGQATIATELGDVEATALVRAGIAASASAETVGELVAIEAQAAGAYWDAWASVAVPFGPRDVKQVPDHWRVVGPRHSPLSGSPRLAVNPAHAVLNYLYALLEIEAALALKAIGLDAGVAVFHADRKGRASLALDVMEACRPGVDLYLLTLLRHRTFRKADFIETSRGDCRLRPAFAKELARTLLSWREQVAPVAEQLTALLASSDGRLDELPTRLTHARRRAAWARRQGPTPGRAPKLPSLPVTCRRCGEPLADRRRRYCDGCRRTSAVEAGKQGRVVAAASLQRLRDAGRDPRSSKEAREQRARKNAAHQAEIVSWDAAHVPADPEVFRTEILPGLRDAKIADLVAATGLSEVYCSLVRLGKRVPHQRHWDELRSLVADATHVSR